MLLGKDVIRPTNLVRIEHPILEDDPPHESVGGATTGLTDLENAALRTFLEEEVFKFQKVSGRASLVEHVVRLKTANPRNIQQCSRTFSRYLGGPA